MAMKTPALRPSLEVLRYLAGRGETAVVEAGAEVLQTPDGPVEALGRVVVGDERTTFFPAAADLGTEEPSRRLAHLVLGPLSGDYLVFLDSQGRALDTPWRTLSRPGLRRRFHLSVFLAEAVGRLRNAEGIGAVLSEALGQEVRTGPTGLNALDDVMVRVARPRPEVPTLAAAARALGLFLGASSLSPGGFRILDGRLPVFEYPTPVGPLWLRAGEVARQALLHPEEGSVLAGAARVVGLVLRDPFTFPSDPVCRWLEWPRPEPAPRSRDGLRASERARGLRQARLDGGRLGGQPEIIRVWRCPSCKEFHSDSQDLPVGALQLESARLRLRRAVDAASREESCSCGGLLVQRRLHHALYAQFLAWPGVDLRLEIERLVDGRLVESWGCSQPAASHRCLPGEASSDLLEQTLDRHDSLATCWLRLMHRAAASGLAEAAPAGSLAWLVVVPPGRPDRVARRLGELLGPLRYGSCRVITLSSTPPGASGTYRAWAGDFVVRLEEGTLGGVALVDWSGFQESVRQALRQIGLEPHPDPERPGRWLVPDPRYWVHLDLTSLLDRGLWGGWYPEEVALGAARQVQEHLSQVQAALDLARRLAPQARQELEPERGRLRICPTPGEPVDLHLDRVLASREGVERCLRFALCPEVPGLEMCRCGEPAHLAVKLRSPSWLASLPADAAAGLACRAVAGPPQVYVRECPHHSVPLQRADLVREGLSEGPLEACVERDLDRTGGRFRALVLAEEGRWAAAFLGPDAASMVCNPGLVAGACEAASLGMPERVRVQVLDLNLLVVSPPDFPATRLDGLIRRAREALSEDPGPEGPVDFCADLHRTAPRGRLTLEGLEEVLA